jgi:hypothetical protein
MSKDFMRFVRALGRTARVLLCQPMLSCQGTNESDCFLTSVIMTFHPCHTLSSPFTDVAVCPRRYSGVQPSSVLMIRVFSDLCGRGI